jgi:hypothetical protein
LGVEETFNGFHNHERGHDEEDGQVDDGADEFGASVTEGKAGVGLFSGNASCDPGDNECAYVAEVVYGVGEQGKAAGEDADHHFDGGEDEVEHDAKDQSAVAQAVGVVVMAVVAVAVMVVVVMVVTVVIFVVVIVVVVTMVVVVVGVFHRVGASNVGIDFRAQS